MKQRLLFLFSMLTFVLVGCSTGNDVTEDYFQPEYDYPVTLSAGRKFFFDDFNENRFSYEGYNYSAPKSDFGLPMDVVKVDTFGEYDVISFIPHFEESLFPDYDWRQENKKGSSRSFISETNISQRIIYEEKDFLIVPFNLDYEITHYMLVPTDNDESKLNELVETATSLDFDFGLEDSDERREDRNTFVGQVNESNGYFLKQIPAD